ncbi:MAG: bifunctional (p)ppGpp synthetase/guanosine-3',5'-bis(diphosphate) 3'-pyrophosphohydrolase [Pseudomonadales bacterium]
MVKVREEQPVDLDGRVDLELWLCKLIEKNPHLNLARVRAACELSEQAEAKAIATNTVWAEGRSSFKTGLAMADILTELRVDEDGIISAIIYRSVRENQITLNHVRNQFGEEVAELVEGVLRMAAISNIQLGSNTPVLGENKDQLEQARRMLVALVDDVRVALIKLAERTCVIRSVASSTEERKLRLAREVFEIYAPLAHRLGIGQLKWELEDLAFRYLDPLIYKKIANLLDGTRTARQEYIDSVIDMLSKEMRATGVDARIDGRAKHIYSIWRKMQSKSINFSEVYDVRAVRILVPEVKDCYSVLGVIHTLWRNVPHEFDDYIAAPKENGYRSLHTAVIGPEGKVLEVQIRTHEMHEEAELGVCSHWQYKTPASSNEPERYEQRIHSLRQLLEWQEELGDITGIAKELLREVNLDRIYLFTREGHVIDMMPGATPVDFAYRVHTEVGHKCRGAKINGRVVPLNTGLKSGDQVEIILGDEARPRREWLFDHLGYVSTSRARAQIRSWFGRRERQKNIDEGKKLLLDELLHLGVEQLDVFTLVDAVEYDSPESLFAAIGAGDVEVLDVVEAASELIGLHTEDQQISLTLGGQQESGPGEVSIFGVGDLAYELSACCQPMSGEPIVGIIADNNMVKIHRKDCLEALGSDIDGRSIEVKWESHTDRTFPVKIEVVAYDRPGLLYDITSVLVHEEINVLSIGTDHDSQESRVVLSMVIEERAVNRLLKTLEKIEQLSNVISARRTTAS